MLYPTSNDESVLGGRVVLSLDRGATILFPCCQNGTLDALTEGFESLVVVFFTTLFLCLACSNLYHLRKTPVTLMLRCVKWFPILLKCVKKRKRLPYLSPVQPADISSNRRESFSASATSSEHPTHGVRHLAVIMDGNRRYGKQHAWGVITPNLTSSLMAVCESVLKGQSVSSLQDERYTGIVSLLRGTALDGHRVGGEKLMEFIDYCLELKVQMLTVYAFSTENWSRPALEVNVLMALFSLYFERIRQISKTHGIFVRFISPAFEMIPSSIKQLMCSVEEESRRHSPRNITINVCVSYSGKAEVVKACNFFAQRLEKTVPISSEEFMSQMLRSVTQEAHEEDDTNVLADGGGVEPQVLLRTSGEHRLSNFMLFECAYTELFFLNKTWPEVTKEDLIQILKEFGQRDRRNGS